MIMRRIQGDHLMVLSWDAFLGDIREISKGISAGNLGISDLEKSGLTRLHTRLFAIVHINLPVEIF
jgi:hypothetical protein